jgi:hypothetical protein
MSTMVGWFASVSQARAAVLDLISGGVPRPNISVITGSSHPELADASSLQPQLSVGDDETVAANDSPHDFIASLFGATTLTLPDIGAVVTAGPLADTLRDATGDVADGGLRHALMGIGTPPDQANLYAEKLRQGGAVLAVQVDNALDDIVHGVFRHSIEPSLREPEEPTGPTPSDELAVDDTGQPFSTSIGALSAGLVPGGWGPATPITDVEAEHIADDQGMPESGT